jgi:hypothetical protein
LQFCIYNLPVPPGPAGAFRVREEPPVKGAIVSASLPRLALGEEIVSTPASGDSAERPEMKAHRETVMDRLAALPFSFIISCSLICHFH